MKDISNQLNRDSTSNIDETPKHGKRYTPYTLASKSSGLADLQKCTTDVLAQTPPWGFGNSSLNVKRHKLDNHTWQLTVVNPKTRKTILQAEGHGDTIFANEDNLARMAETLMAQGLTIRTHFDD